MSETVPPDALDRLEAVTRDLDAYLERRAIEIAAPRIAAAEDAAAAKVREAKEKAQRAEDVVAELRRQQAHIENALDDLRIRFGQARDPHVVERRGDRGAGRPPAGWTRLVVNANQETVDALQLVVDREGVSLAEAHRRLVEYGGLVYREIRVAENQVVIRGGGCDREVLLG